MKEFYDDVREKSLLAQNAHKRARRPARPKSRILTDKEWKQLNGNVSSCNLNAPMEYANFKELPTGMQTQYIQGIVDKYGVGPNAIGQMLGCKSRSAGSQIFKQLGIKVKGRAPHGSAKKFLQEFCGASDSAIQEPLAPQAAKSALTMQSTVLNFSGFYRPDAIACKLNGLFPNSTKVQVRIEIQAAD